MDGAEAPRARQALEESVAELRRAGVLADTAYGLATLGQVTMRSGDLDRATAVYEECLQLAERLDNDHLETLVLHQLGFTALLAGDRGRAREYFDASIAANRNLLDQEGLAFCMDGFAAVAQARGRPEAAARLHAAAARRREVLGITVWPELYPLIDQRVAAARSALGPVRFEQEWAAGRQLQSADALTYARDVSRP